MYNVQCLVGRGEEAGCLKLGCGYITISKTYRGQPGSRYLPFEIFVLSMFIL